MYRVASFYKFMPFTDSDLDGLQEILEVQADELQLGGLIIIAPEGVNGTVCGAPAALASFTQFLTSHLGLAEFKESESESLPFVRFKVKRRDEIVTTSTRTAVIDAEAGEYLTPADWHDLLSKRSEEILVLDVRNKYETALGVFEAAIDPEINNFKDFSDYVSSSEIPKDKTILMYCTGGIRCEKASVEMKRQGYDKVFQLHGGILKYLEEYPDGHFHGECFVFDRRVALTKDLEPSTTYGLCPHCGDPGKEKIICDNCGEEAKVCRDCRIVADATTCSKDCSYQLARRRERLARKNVGNAG